MIDDQIAISKQAHPSERDCLYLERYGDEKKSRQV